MRWVSFDCVASESDPRALLQDYLDTLEEQFGYVVKKVEFADAGEPGDDCTTTGKGRLQRKSTPFRLPGMNAHNEDDDDDDENEDDLANYVELRRATPRSF